MASFLSQFYNGTYSSKYIEPIGLADIVLVTEPEYKILEKRFVVEITYRLKDAALYGGDDMTIFQSRSGYAFISDFDFQTEHFYQVFQHAYQAFQKGFLKADENRQNPPFSIPSIEPIEQMKNLLEHMLLIYRSM